MDYFLVLELDVVGLFLSCFLLGFYFDCMEDNFIFLMEGVFFNSIYVCVWIYLVVKWLKVVDCCSFLFGFVNMFFYVFFFDGDYVFFLV